MTSLQDISPEDQRAFVDEYKNAVAEAFKRQDEMIRERQQNISGETKLMRSLLWAMCQLGLQEDAKKILAKHGITPEEAIFGKQRITTKKRRMTMETIEDVVKRLRDRAEARRRSGKLLQIDDRMFDLIADEIEEATRDKSSQVGDMAAMREALEVMLDWYDEHHDDVAAMDEAMEKARDALSKPPRNCDVGTEIDQRKRYAEMCQYNCDMCSLQHKRALKGGCELAWAQMPYEKRGAK